ncbi:MAG: ABC transporter substrate-binding protein [Acidimicrobiales bacterium]
MTPSRRRLVSALVLVCALVAAACGQKAGVHVASGGGGTGSGGGFEAGGGDLGGGDLGGVTGDPSVDGAGGGSTGGSTSGGSTSGGSTSGGSTSGGSRGGTSGGGGSSGGSGSSGQQASGPAWGDTVVIGIHAPITGAAPLPSSFAAAASVYADWINAKGGIHGRKIRVEVANDEYQPATAVQRCRELVQQKNAFLLIGGGGTDQIQACARFAESAGVPYLSAGVTEIGLRGLKGYFAVSMSYKQQGAYLANYVKKTWPDKADTPAMVYSDTPNFQDAVEGYKAAMPNVKLYKLSRVPSSTELANTARELCVDQREVAYPLMAPKDWLTLVGSQPCTLQWAGVGLTMGLDTVANTGCRSSGEKINGSVFFSPFPGIDKAAGIDPDFAEATKGKNPDDIFAALFAVNKAVGELLKRTGPQLSRAAFVSTASNAKNIATGLNPVLNYSPNDHFGADAVHVLKAVCDGNQSGKYQTIGTFAKF